MILFLDTEYADLQNQDPISIGLVSEDGQFEFYAERNDFRYDLCSDFTKGVVLPLLDRNPATTMGYTQLADALVKWLTTLPRNLVIACDYRGDADIFNGFLDHAGTNFTQDKLQMMNLRVFVGLPVYDHAAHGYWKAGHPRHHALHDARAHRFGWLAWNDMRRQKSLGNKTIRNHQQVGSRTT